jgi:hypothetical protein
VGTCVCIYPCTHTHTHTGCDTSTLLIQQHHPQELNDQRRAADEAAAAAAAAAKLKKEAEAEAQVWQLQAAEAVAAATRTEAGEQEEEGEAGSTGALRMGVPGFEPLLEPRGVEPLIDLDTPVSDKHLEAQEVKTRARSNLHRSAPPPPMGLAEPPGHVCEGAPLIDFGDGDGVATAGGGGEGDGEGEPDLVVEAFAASSNGEWVTFGGEGDEGDSGDLGGGCDGVVAAVAAAEDAHTSLNDASFAASGAERRGVFEGGGCVTGEDEGREGGQGQGKSVTGVPSDAPPVPHHTIALDWGGQEAGGAGRSSTCEPKADGSAVDVSGMEEKTDTKTKKKKR